MYRSKKLAALQGQGTGEWGRVRHRGGIWEQLWELHRKWGGPAIGRIWHPTAPQKWPRWMWMRLYRGYRRRGKAGYRAWRRHWARFFRKHPLGPPSLRGALYLHVGYGQNGASLFAGSREEVEQRIRQEGGN